MALDTITPGEQQYSLRFTDNETKQQVLCHYNSNAILTTDYLALLEYTHTQVQHWKEKRTYSICMVMPMTILGQGHITGTTAGN